MEYAFFNCKSLKSIDIPSGVTEIGYSAFQNCESITSITIPEGVTTLQVGLFENCYSLESVDVPDTVDTIENMVFEGCSAAVTYNGSTYTPDNYSDLYSSGYMDENIEREK